MEQAQDSREEIWKMFDAISHRYDLMNHLLSFGIDFYWRNSLLKHLPNTQDMRLLDLATGTGDQLITLIKKAKHITAALGIDLSTQMIRKGQKKLLGQPFSHRVTLMPGDATAIELEDETVDCVTLSFGIRNVTDVEKCLSECYRVLTHSGRLIILEFSLPKNRLIRALHLFYLRYLLPPIAGWISRNPEAYRYLSHTIETFPSGEAFCALMQKAGFYHVKAYPLTFGIASLYVGEKIKCGIDL